MTTAIYESLTETYYNEETDKNEKYWYEKYIHKACKQYALLNYDEDEDIERLVIENYKEAMLYLEEKYNIDCFYGLSNEDIYIALLEKWTLQEHEEDFKNYKK
jgi:hypothetical protein